MQLTRTSNEQFTDNNTSDQKKKSIIKRNKDWNMSDDFFRIDKKNAPFVYLFTYVERIYNQKIRISEK